MHCESNVLRHLFANRCDMRANATRRLHGHHIEHWADGGVTALHNLVQLCPHHHRLVHEGGFGVQVVNESTHGGGLLRFLRPDGTLINDTVPRVAIDACATRLLKQRNAQLGLLIDAQTVHPNWDGEPMDRAMAIDGMFSASGDFAITAGP